MPARPGPARRRGAPTHEPCRDVRLQRGHPRHAGAARGCHLARRGSRGDDRRPAAGPTERVGDEFDRDGVRVLRIPLPHRWRRWWRISRAPLGRAELIWAPTERSAAGLVAGLVGPLGWLVDLAVRDHRLGSSGRGSGPGRRRLPRPRPVRPVAAERAAARHRRPARVRQPRALHGIAGHGPSAELVAAVRRAASRPGSSRGRTRWSR